MMLKIWVNGFQKDCIKDPNSYFNLHKNMLGKGYIFKNSDVEFWFDYLENYLKKILRNEDTYVKKEIIFDLKHNLRYCSCFYKNMIISANIENSFFCYRFD